MYHIPREKKKRVRTHMWEKCKRSKFKARWRIYVFRVKCSQASSLEWVRYLAISKIRSKMHRAKYIGRRQVFEKETKKLNQIWTMWFFFPSPLSFRQYSSFWIKISQIYKLVNLKSNLVDQEDKSNILCNRNGDGILFIFFFNLYWTYFS